MTTNVLTNLDFNRNAIIRALLNPVAAFPTVPAPRAGEVCYLTTDNRLYYFDGTIWVDPRLRSNHTGTQLAATISDLAATINARSLSAFTAPTADLSVGGFKLLNVADPVLSTDGANKNYVDNAVAGTDYKASVLVAATVNTPLTSLNAVDGITPVAGSRILLTAQTAPAENGFWIASAGAWTRALDADGVGELTDGATVLVEQGTNADTRWTLSTNNPITIGTTALTFVKTAAATVYTGGTGITLAANAIAVDTAVVVRKVTALIGDAAAFTFAVAHNLANQFVQAQVFEVATNQEVIVDIIQTSANVVTITFAGAPNTPPAANAYRVVVQG
jgi:hypothetical protein